MAALLGAKAQSTYQRWEAQPDAPSSKTALDRAKAVFAEKSGRPWQGDAIQKVESRGIASARAGTVSETTASYPVTGALPEHIQEAYKIVREALDIAKADISTMDQDQVGLVIGLAAEEVAKGNRAEARQTLLRRAEVLLGLKSQ